MFAVEEPSGRLGGRLASLPARSGSKPADGETKTQLPAVKLLPSALSNTLSQPPAQLVVSHVSAAAGTLV